MEIQLDNICDINTIYKLPNIMSDTQKMLGFLLLSGFLGLQKGNSLIANMDRNILFIIFLTSDRQRNERNVPVC